MASNVINNPRIDRAFVNQAGQLTEYGYAVLARIIERVGGSVGDILDGRSLAEAIANLDEAVGRLEALPAAVAAHSQAIDRVQASEMAMQPFEPISPISTESTWQT